MKQFDWEFCANQHAPEYVAFLKGTHDKLLTEEAFVAAFVKMPRKDNKPKRGMRSPCIGRQAYKNLKKNFGFFI